MNRAIPILFFCIISFIGLVGCSADDHRDELDGGGTKIVASIQSLPQHSVETKAPYNETTPSVDNPLKARVLASKTSGDYTESTGKLHADGTMTFTGTGLTPYDTEGFSGKNFYEVDGSSLYFCALYPDTAWTTSPTTTASFTFTGKEDVMFAPQTSSKISQAANKPEFTFNHLLTKLHITLVAENEGLQNAWGEVTGITLENVPNTVTVTLGGTNIETAASYEGNTSLNAHLIADDTQVSDDAPVSIALESDELEVQAYILAAPVIASKDTDTNEYTLRIKTSNGSVRTVGLDLKKDADTFFEGSTQGRSFNVILHFKGDKITVDFANADNIQLGGWATSLVLQTIMLSSDRPRDRANMLVALRTLNTINQKSVSHKYSYFGLYGVNDVTHDMIFDVDSLAEAGLLSSFQTGQHVMFDLKKLIRLWGVYEENPDDPEAPDEERPFRIILKNYVKHGWELVSAMQHPNPQVYPEVDCTTSATLPAKFPKTANRNDSVLVQLSDTLYAPGSIIIKKK
ncbi:fimbrillin family protein [Parabacteroides sp. OttesenSCG-928-K15]|nr:fimbrillin family protein [Parabacteroides sp. OttesenSCG-928-K15]